MPDVRKMGMMLATLHEVVSAWPDREPFLAIWSECFEWFLLWDEGM